MSDSSHELEQEKARLERVARDQKGRIEQANSAEAVARQKLIDMAAQLEQANAALVGMRAQAASYDEQLQRALADHAAARKCAEKLESTLATHQQVRAPREGRMLPVLVSDGSFFFFFFLDPGYATARTRCNPRQHADREGASDQHSAGGPTALANGTSAVDRRGSSEGGRDATATRGVTFGAVVKGSREHKTVSSTQCCTGSGTSIRHVYSA